MDPIVHVTKQEKKLTRSLLGIVPAASLKLRMLRLDAFDENTHVSDIPIFLQHHDQQHCRPRSLAQSHDIPSISTCHLLWNLSNPTLLPGLR